MSVDYSVLFRAQQGGGLGEAIARGFEGYDRKQERDQRMLLTK